MKIRFLSNTNIRRSPRDFSLPPIGVIFAGTEIDVYDRLFRGKELEGINTYFRDEKGWYYWSGRAAIMYKAIPAPANIQEDLPFDYERVGGDWEIPLDSENAVSVTEPQILEERESETLEDAFSNEVIEPVHTIETEDGDVFEEKIPEREPQADVEEEVYEPGLNENTVSETNSKALNTEANKVDTVPIYSTATHMMPAAQEQQESLLPHSSKPEGRQLSSAEADHVLDQFEYRPDLVTKCLTDLKIPALFWERLRLSGRQVNICVLDTGADLIHPDLEEAVTQFEDFTLSTGAFCDLDGSGTHAAGLIAGRGREKLLGAAPAANLLIGKVKNYATEINFDAFFAGLEWAINQKADIVFTSNEFPETSLNSIQLERLQKLVDKAFIQGVTLVAAAGDSRYIKPENRFPAAFARCLSVGAHNRNLKRHPLSVKSASLDILAPAYCLPTKFRNAKVTGTAAAFTTGVLALLIEYWTRQRISYSPQKILNQVRINATSSMNSGENHSLEFGYGLLNPEGMFHAIKKH